MIKVLHYVAIMNRGGQETFIMNVFRSINRKEVIFDFLCTLHREGAYDSEIKGLGGTVYHLPIENKKNNLFNRCITLKKFLRKHSKEYKVFHIHTQNAMDGYLNAMIAVNAGIEKVIVHSHSTSTLYHPCVHKIFRPLLRNRKIIRFACSDLAGKWLFGDNTRYEIIKNGVDTSLFKYSENIRNRMRSENGWNGLHVVGHVGSFTYPKNHSFLIEVFNEVAKKDENAVLVLVGGGELLTEVKKKAECLGLQNKIFYLGNRNDVNELDNAFDIFVFPSYYEGLPVVLVEAQSTGVPCLVSDSITPEVFVSDNIETLSIKESAKIWAEKTETIINEKRDRQNCKESVIKAGFDIKDTAKFLQKFYCE